MGTPNPLTNWARRCLAAISHTDADRLPWRPIMAMVTFFLVLSSTTSIAALNGHSIHLNENQILYLFSTSAQVIAAIYGLTLTGFIFLRNELSREEFEDETLAQVVESLKLRYFTLLVFITALVSLTLLISNLAIAYEKDGTARNMTVVLNAGQSAYVTSLLAVAFFIFDVISPKRTYRASQALKLRIDPETSSTKGNLEEFLRNYNRIEGLLQTASELSEEEPTSRFPLHRRPSLIRLVEILFRNERIGKDLSDGLRELITLRNSIIHGADPVVSPAAVEKSAVMLEQLDTALKG